MFFFLNICLFIQVRDEAVIFSVPKWDERESPLFSHSCVFQFCVRVKGLFFFRCSTKGFTNQLGFIFQGQCHIQKLKIVNVLSDHSWKHSSRSRQKVLMFKGKTRRSCLTKPSEWQCNEMELIFHGGGINDQTAGFQVMCTELHSLWGEQDVTDQFYYSGWNYPSSPAGSVHKLCFFSAPPILFLIFIINSLISWMSSCSFH